MTLSRMLGGSMLGLAAALIGCGGGGPSKTPQEVHKKAKAAADSGKYADILPLFAPEEQDMVAFGMVMACGFVGMGNEGAKKEAEEILKRHGVKENKDEKVNMADSKAMKEAAAKVFQGVNKSALFGDLVTFLEKHGKREMSFKASLAGDLKDLKIDGNKASGKVNDKPMHFVKSGEGWYLATGQ